MTNQEFEQLMQKQFEEIINLAKKKGKEYAKGEDRLSNLKDTAELEKVSVPVSIFSKMSKHIISLRDMIGTEESYTETQWDEKIDDIIVYCMLMKAGLKEERRIKKVQKEEYKCAICGQHTSYFAEKVPGIDGMICIKCRKELKLEKGYTCNLCGKEIKAEEMRNGYLAGVLCPACWVKNNNF